MEVRSSTFKVNIYDGCSRLVYTTEIKISAETTALEFFYNNELNYGDIKGWKSHTIQFDVTSKGRYEIHCQFADIVDENLENQAIRKYFTIQPTEGKILPNIKFSSTITFSPDRVMILEKLPVFKCLLIDPFHEVVIKALDIFVSARVFLSKFEICPYPEIYFGYQAVGQEKLHTCQIFNKGKFDFNYTVQQYVKQAEVKKKKSKKEKGKKRSKSKSKSK
ncbi:uncharacterized protein LOC135133803 [Zophobas morio]|uniref:uncharacterized protein LOC135133803 n=1 Tax=Zophobas morio TaxID=2755281 RepID=UPI00308317C7